ncbi:predicted protein [Pyrenophora tritici-repentis Pt-1C-BFP]|uniref:Uncharacterized protein n=1 Tax=Pyrenophora tritici-repentis (strain Pt-1C-BFP) TaxID=426418 RepID=B2WBT8_PYRTR|nr:uncharacterized protein PTRG_07101 [Pyrenophora tritici-repentis Pt-1C-BFP]EDU50020.1 predicted protein [Pyrenophora tritici-repentis Pt-1C-BFP]
MRQVFGAGVLVGMTLSRPAGKGGVEKEGARSANALLTTGDVFLLHGFPSQCVYRS